MPNPLDTKVLDQFPGQKGTLKLNVNGIKEDMPTPCIINCYGKCLLGKSYGFS